MTTLEQALEYLSWGWSIFPLKPRSKEPAVALAPYLSGELRLSPNDARQVWADGRDYGIGIVCGLPSKLLVIDVDPRNGGDLAAVAESISGMVGRVRTGGGGVHWYLQDHSDVRKGKTAWPGVDRQANGSYVCAPPSIHPGTGQRWEWDVKPYEGYHADTSGRNEVPTWVLESAPRPTAEAPGEGKRWVADILLNPEACRIGSQEETLSKLCWYAARHWEQDVAASILFAWLCRVPQRANDPWEYDHLTAKLERAYENYEPESTWYAHLVDDIAASTIKGLLTTAKDFAATQPEVIDWIVPRFVSPGEWTEIIGLMKSGKSTLLYWMIHAMLYGHDFLGEKPKAGSVVLYTEQDRNSLRATLGRGQLLEAEGLHILRPSQTRTLSWTKVIPGLIEAAVDIGSKVIVIDTLNTLAGVVDGNEESEAQRVLQPALLAKEAGVALVFSRHSNKNAASLASLGLAGRGSGQFTGAMDTVCVLASPHGEASSYRKLFIGGRLIDHDTLHLKYEHGHHEIDPDGEPVSDFEKQRDAERGENEAKIMKALIAQPMNVSDLVKATGLSETTVRRRLNLADDVEMFLHEGKKLWRPCLKKTERNNDGNGTD